jgi:hypothetical protein
MIPKDVNAVGICSARDLNKLRSEALKIKVSYKTVKNSEGITKYNITISNLSTNLVIKYNGIAYSGTPNNTSVTIPGLFEPKGTYSFEIQSGDLQICGHAYLSTKKITLPYYNKYSEADECVEYEEAPVCQIHYEGEIKNYNDFLTQLDSYIKSIAPEKEPYKDTRNIFQKIIDWCKDNIEITVAIISILVLIILIFIIVKIHRYRKRVKLRL